MSAIGGRTFRHWSLWSLAPALIATVVVVDGVATIVASVAIAWMPFDALAIVIVALLFLGGVFSVEARRLIPLSSDTLSNTMLGLWTYPAALLLPPGYAVVAAIGLETFCRYRRQRAQLYRNVYSVAVVVVAHGVTWMVFTILRPPILGSKGAGETAQWLIAATLAVGAGIGLSTLLMTVTMKLWRPELRWTEAVGDRELLGSDVVEGAAAVLVAALATISPVLLVLTAPLVLLQRGIVFSRYHSAARLDAKTGLLNAGTWQKEASGELVCARRTRTPLAVLLLDLDGFKNVNDTYGHLAGDRVLRAVSETLMSQVRQDDIVGRFGGDEFVVALPKTGPRMAWNIAERLRSRIGVLAVPVANGMSARVTVSIGLAFLVPDEAPIGDRDVVHLLAAADSSLYQAKRDGRDRCAVVSASA
jgi:diguanylate cyclase (GGDEF)-like protein